MATNSIKERKSKSAKPPVVKLRLGLIYASIWERITDNGTFYSVTFERRYRDSNGEWHSTHNFDANGLLTLAKLADMAHSKIVELQTTEAAA